MALNSSGPISLGGATTGESINLELGQASLTTVSLNDTNVRNLAGVASGAITMPTDFWGKSNVNYFWSFITDTSKSYASNNFLTASDTSNNYYISYRTAVNSTNFVKIDSSGSSILNQQKYTISTNGYNLESMAISGTKLVAVGTRNNANTPTQRSTYCLDVYDTTTLNLITSNQYSSNPTSPVNSLWTNIAPTPDSSGNLYFEGKISATSTYGNVAKYDVTTNTITMLQASSTIVSNSRKGNVDPITNCVYWGSNSSGPDRWLAIKLNSSFTASDWVVEASSSAVVSEGNYGVVAYNNHVYGDFSRAAATSTYRSSIAKIDSTTGNITSLKSLAPSITATYNTTAMTIDNNGNFYGIINNGVSFAPILYKYDTSMVLQWQRTLSLSAGIQTISMYVTQNQSLVIFAWLNTSPYNKWFIITYPLDGSVTGSWSNSGYSLTISAASLSETTITPPSVTNTYSFSPATPNSPTTAVTFTPSSSSSTITKVNIP